MYQRQVQQLTREQSIVQKLKEYMDQESEFYSTLNSANFLRNKAIFDMSNKDELFKKHITTILYEGLRIDQFLTMNTHIHRFLLLLVGQEEDALSLATPIIEDLQEDFALLYKEKQGFFQLASEYATLIQIKKKAELFEDAKRNIIPLIQQLREKITESIEDVKQLQQLHINEPSRSSTSFKENNLYKFLTTRNIEELHKVIFNEFEHLLHYQNLIQLSVLPNQIADYNEVHFQKLIDNGDLFIASILLRRFRIAKKKNEKLSLYDYFFAFKSFLLVVDGLFVIDDDHDEVQEETYIWYEQYTQFIISHITEYQLGSSPTQLIANINQLLDMFIASKRSVFQQVKQEADPKKKGGKRSHTHHKPKRRSNTNHSRKHRLKQFAHRTPKRRTTRRCLTYLRSSGRRRKSIRT